MKETVKKLKDMKVERIYAGHCTGFEAMGLFMVKFGKAFEPLYVGKVIELG